MPARSAGALSVPSLRKLITSNIIFVFSLLLAVLIVHTMADQKDNALMVVRANNKFTSTVYDLLRQTPGNVFYSPISLHTALSMLHQGAEEKSLSALSGSLNLNDKASSADGFQKITRELNNVKGVTLEIANKLYVKTGYSFKQAFKDVVVEKFNAALEDVNFAENEAAAKAINTWVEEKTHDKIKDLISADDLDADTRSVIVNAIYFKGDWKEKFDKSRTKKEPFYTSETDHVEVDMMHLTKSFDYKVDRDLDAQVIKLPYANNKLSMVIVLPNKRTGITELEEKLANYDLNKLTNDMYKTKVILALPRFKIETKMDLNEPLKKAGLSNIFGNEANFSGVLESQEPLVVSKVVQKAFIEVNEEGSEAAAATGVMVMRRCMPIRREFVDFVADRPFRFYLQHDAGGALFAGRLKTI